jgi:hypothetical protein
MKSANKRNHLMMIIAAVIVDAQKRSEHFRPEKVLFVRRPESRDFNSS